GLATDQRGLPRTAGTGTDIGACEGTGDRPIVLPPALADVTTAGSATYSFDVTYTCQIAIATSSLDSTDVRVAGPNNFDVPAVLVRVDTTADGSPRTATYRFTPPGGTWDGSDNGTYTVTLQANQVFDTSGDSAAAGTLGH